MRIAGGTLKGRELKSPKGGKTRPTSSKVRESLFNILQNEIEGATFLDLFAGSGSMGIEALSRGAEAATFIEKEKMAATVLRENLKNLGLEARLIQADVFAAVPRLVKKGDTFTIIYADPPYALDLTPLLETLPLLLTKRGILIIEQAKGVELNLPNLPQCDVRNFGDTSIHIFRK